ncbi:hypothetical protein NLJ89_g11472 [Agrocybe chaxingu]|uniref:Uncharacterized protein n=1 Tax=Agrocybe chaxingu TaxID=84603 RepID=A0A9W8MPC2_9AGAR|nr:hypothetical protein NLJ89_g11472 [Agrocybe chaxingu]
MQGPDVCSRSVETVVCMAGKSCLYSARREVCEPCASCHGRRTLGVCLLLHALRSLSDCPPLHSRGPPSFHAPPLPPLSSTFFLLSFRLPFHVQPLTFPLSPSSILYLIKPLNFSSPALQYPAQIANYNFSFLESPDRRPDAVHRPPGPRLVDCVLSLGSVAIRSTCDVALLCLIAFCKCWTPRPAFRPLIAFATGPPNLLFPHVDGLLVYCGVPSTQPPYPSSTPPPLPPHLRTQLLCDPGPGLHGTVLSPDVEVERMSVVRRRGFPFGGAQQQQQQQEEEREREPYTGLVLTAEEIKDVVCSTGLWLVVREGFGGVGKVSRKGDGWRIRA